MSSVQFVEVVLRLRARDKDGYGVVKMAVPSDAIRWEGVPREDLSLDDVYQVSIIITEHSETKHHQMIEKDLD